MPRRSKYCCLRYVFDLLAILWRREERQEVSTGIAVLNLLHCQNSWLSGFLGHVFYRMGALKAAPWKLSSETDWCTFHRTQWVLPSRLSLNDENISLPIGVKKVSHKKCMQWLHLSWINSLRYNSAQMLILVAVNVSLSIVCNHLLFVPKWKYFNLIRITAVYYIISDYWLFPFWKR